MARSIRIRNLARAVGVGEDDVLYWLLENAPEENAQHAADHVSPEAAEAVRQALGRAEAPQVPEERRCAACRGLAATPGVRLVSVATASACEICRGSVNRRAALELLEAFAERGYARLLVVGGGPGTADELRSLLGVRMDLRIVDGEAHRDAAQAETELAWADVVAIWGGTILAHKVSTLYTNRRERWGEKIVTVTRRGAAALCREVVRKVRSAC